MSTISDALKQMVERDIKEKETMNKRFRLVIWLGFLLFLVVGVALSQIWISIQETKINRKLNRQGIEETRINREFSKKIVEEITTNRQWFIKLYHRLGGDTTHVKK